jgi:hypothetical protein
MEYTSSSWSKTERSQHVKPVGLGNTLGSRLIIPKNLPSDICTVGPHQWSGRFLSTIGWDPNVCKSNRLHVDILRFSFNKLGYILL